MGFIIGAESRLDPFVFEKGGAPTLAGLRGLGRDDANLPKLRFALNEYLNAYVMEDQPDLERLFFAGERCQTVGLKDADRWSVDWIKSVDASRHVRGGKMLVAFLSGFYGEHAPESPALTSIQQNLARLEADLASAVETIDADFERLRQNSAQG